MQNHRDLNRIFPAAKLMTTKKKDSLKILKVIQQNSSLQNIPTKKIAKENNRIKTKLKKKYSNKNFLHNKKYFNENFI